MTDLVYISVALRGSAYRLIIKERGGQPNPKEYTITKPQLAALLSGASWALYEDLLRCDPPQPTAPHAATSAER